MPKKGGKYGAMTSSGRKAFGSSRSHRRGSDEKPYKISKGKPSIKGKGMRGNSYGRR